MGTRSIVARVGNNEGEFSGRYCHWDGSPSTRGVTLWKIIHDEFKSDLKAALVYLIDKHPAGWSSLEKKECYCHPQNAKDRPDFKGRKPEPAQTFTHKQLKDSDAEWLYVFDEEKNRLYVRDVRHDAETLVELAEPEPNWKIIECSEDLSRCGHMAWYHDLVPRTCNLSTQTWLGNRPLKFHDAIAFVINGKRYASTGCGGNSDYVNRTGTKPFPRGCWIASVKAGNGRRMDFPVAEIAGDGYTPYPNVIWIMPPTKDNPKETRMSA
jgi:hypothetical protein